MGPGAAGPGVIDCWFALEQAQQAVDACIPDAAIDALGAKCAGQLGDACRGFAGLGDGGGDEKD